MSAKVGPNSQHGVATRNAGCKCDSCRKAKRMAQRRIRAAHRRARGVEPGDVCCSICGTWVKPRGLGAHERIHDDD